MEISNAKFAKIYFLQDYASLDQYWRLTVLDGNVVQTEAVPRREDELVVGMFERWRLAGEDVSMGFLSELGHEVVTGNSAYSKHLLIILNGRLFGDGLSKPKLFFREGVMRREFSVRTEDGWKYNATYRSPWIRETIRRILFGGPNTLEYNPVDLIERLVEVVETYRPDWMDS